MIQRREDLSELLLSELAGEYTAATLDTDQTSAARMLEQLSVLAEIRSLAEKQIASYAFLAVCDGSSWAEVGTALGVTRQAAQQKYGRNPDGVTPEQVLRQTSP